MSVPRPVTVQVTLTAAEASALDLARRAGGVSRASYTRATLRRALQGLGHDVDDDPTAPRRGAR